MYPEMLLEPCIRQPSTVRTFMSANAFTAVAAAVVAAVAAVAAAAAALVEAGRYDDELSV